MTKLVRFDQAETQADQAYDALLAEILDCRLAPGAKIRISDIAARLNLSPGAVREALSRLSAEKWTVATAQKGYSVTTVSGAELKDLTRTRITIEQLCLRSAVANGDVEWETSAVAAYHRLHRIPMMMMDAGVYLSPTWAAAHTTFHAALVAGCDSPWMLNLRGMLYAQSERYRNLSFVLAREDRDVDSEHRGILDACLARNADLACTLIEQHLQRTADILLTSRLLHEHASKQVAANVGP
jgi:GntR family transcriptional regulator, carbon starvation induced regulator